MMSLHFVSIISLVLREFQLFTCDVIISTFYVNMTFDFSSHDYNLSISTVIIMTF